MLRRRILDIAKDMSLEIMYRPIEYSFSSKNTYVIYFLVTC